MGWLVTGFTGHGSTYWATPPLWLTSADAGYRLLLFVAQVITPTWILMMASMTCWSDEALGDPLGLGLPVGLGEKVGVGLSVGEGDGETGRSTSTRMNCSVLLERLPLENRRLSWSPEASWVSVPSTLPVTLVRPSASSDQQVIDAIIKIQVGVITWATNNNNLYPASAEVSQSGGVAQYVDPWPVNPVTNQPMTPGTQAGDYTYEQLNGGQGYKLTGYLGNGLTYTVP